MAAAHVLDGTAKPLEMAAAYCFWRPHILIGTVAAHGLDGTAKISRNGRTPWLDHQNSDYFRSNSTAKLVIIISKSEMKWKCWISSHFKSTKMILLPQSLEKSNAFQMDLCSRPCSKGFLWTFRNRNAIPMFRYLDVVLKFDKWFSKTWYKIKWFFHVTSSSNLEDSIFVQFFPRDGRTRQKCFWLCPRL